MQRCKLAFHLIEAFIVHISFAQLSSEPRGGARAFSTEAEDLSLKATSTVILKVYNSV